MYREIFFKRVCLLTIVSVFLLFILGGLVRSTGSGMGCPDWPRCFGKIIPPTDSSSLPANYKQQFLQKRLQKTERFTELLKSLGLKKLALKVATDPQLKITHPYNLNTAYIEYINRVVGMLTGIFALLTLFSAFRQRKENFKAFGWVLFGNFMVIFNGWLGSVVVDTNLVPGIVTLHYAAAYLAMGGFIFAFPNPIRFKISLSQKRILWFAILLLLIEIFLGTTTREIIDGLKQTDLFVLNNQTVWVPGTLFFIHRLLGIIILLLNVYLLFILKKIALDQKLIKIQSLIIVLLGCQIVSGFINVIFDIPALVNVIHISASAAVVGLQLWVLKNLNKN